MGRLISSPTSTTRTLSNKSVQLSSYQIHPCGSAGSSYLACGQGFLERQNHNLANSLTKNYSFYSCSREEAKEGNGLTIFNYFFLKTKPPQKSCFIEISKFKHRNTKFTASSPPNQHANPTYVCSQHSVTISLKSPETLMHILSTKAAAEQQALTHFPL